MIFVIALNQSFHVFFCIEIQIHSY